MKFILAMAMPLVLLALACFTNTAVTEYVVTNAYTTNGCSSTPVVIIAAASPTGCAWVSEGSFGFQFCKGSTLFNYTCSTSDCSGSCTTLAVNPTCSFNDYYGVYQVQGCADAPPPAGPNSLVSQHYNGSSTCDPSVQMDEMATHELDLCLPQPSAPTFYMYEYSQAQNAVLALTCSDSLCTENCQCFQVPLGCEGGNGMSFLYSVSTGAQPVNRTCQSAAPLRRPPHLRPFAAQ
eukprot:TRINITY_DN27824_c0_g1_i1.p2 TRINITY_DN27824_c0_g1~~TRINITY_DN27824_c0_g1_i1.p2  ORF type:complete len:235 (-),score=33.43 TRINITY_DN27824_c0_g1_i1:493-1197(-)